jgi:hypothetical protein
MKNYAFIFLVMILATGCHLETDQTSNPLASWKTFQIPEYNLEFKYPPNAGAKENKIPFFQHDAEAGVSRWPDGIPGEITIDGLHQFPYSIKLSPEFHFAADTEWCFPIRFIMLTDAAKLKPMWAKKYHWTETPTISMYPFDFNRDKDALLTAIERLYLERPKLWSEVKPITVDGKAGVNMSTWDYILGNSGEKFFHEIVAVPVSTNKILIIQAGYYQTGDFPRSGFLQPPKIVRQSVMQLKANQQIFSNVVSSVRFLEN